MDGTQAILSAEESGIVQRASMRVTNPIAVNGFVRSQPVVRADNPIWPLSSARADTVRNLLETSGMPPDRIRRVTGHADRKPVATNPMSIRNNRVEVTLLRR